MNPPRQSTIKRAIKAAAPLGYVVKLAPDGTIWIVPAVTGLTPATDEDETLNRELNAFRAGQHGHG